MKKVILSRFAMVTSFSIKQVSPTRCIPAHYVLHKLIHFININQDSTDSTQQKPSLTTSYHYPGFTNTMQSVLLTSRSISQLPHLHTRFYRYNAVGKVHHAQQQPLPYPETMFLPSIVGNSTPSVTVNYDTTQLRR